MKFSIDKSYFHSAISELSRSVSANSDSHILTGIKLTAHPEGLSLVVSNHDFFIEKTIPNNSDEKLAIYESGSVVVPAKYIVELIKKLPDEIMVKILENNKLSIRSKEINVNLSGFNSEEYPVLPVMSLRECIHMQAEPLLEMVRQTAFAASVSDARPVLTGILISFQENKVTCAATNSHRLALREINIETVIEGSFIVPQSSIKELIKLFSNSQEPISIYVSENYLVFKTFTLTLYTRLIEGNYPNLSSLIPSDFKTVVTISTSNLLIGIDRASLFARNSRNNKVKLELLNRNRLRISSHSSDFGKIEETQQIVSVQGNLDLSISLNSTFLIEALKSIVDEEVTLSFSGSMRPVLIKPTSTNQHLHLISPVRE
jgi:DNA polymerase III subunit beta